jgi:very-short-patch-repair endonuclease
VAGAVDTKESRILAAVKAAGPDALLSHRSAAELIGLEGIESGDEIEVVNHTGNELVGVKVHRLRPTDRPRRMFVRGIPCTRVERILIDLCGWLPRRIVGRALDDALRRKLVTLATLRKELDIVGGRGRRGTKDFRILVATRDRFDSEMRSPFERKMRQILKRIKEYDAIPNFKVRTAKKNRYFDFCYPTLLLGIECHSVGAHLGDEKLKDDAKRDRELGALGYEILYFTWEEVWFEPDSVEREMRAAIARREVLVANHR